MNITEKQKYYIRFGLWIASLAWAAFFLIYSFVVFDRVVLPWLEKTYIGFPLWTSAVFYILVVLTAVVIFFWFFNRLFGRKKASKLEDTIEEDSEGDS